MIPVRLIHSAVQDRRLTYALIKGRDWPSVVIGNDLNRVNYLASVLNARDAIHQDWRAISLRDVPKLKDTGKVIGREDYSSLISLNRKTLVWNLKRAGATVGHVPKAAAFVEVRLLGGRDSHENRTSMEWVHWKTEQTLQELGIQFVDDPDYLFNSQNLPSLKSNTGNYQLVGVVSSPLSRGEAATLAAYLGHEDYTAPQREVTVVVEDHSAWREFVDLYGKSFQISEEDLASHGNEWPRTTERVRLGRVSWEQGRWIKHMRRIKNLLIQTIRDGGKAGDLRIVTDTVDRAYYLRTELHAMGLPIQCSMSELLPANPIALDLMSLVTLVRNREHIQSICRLALHLPSEPGLDALRDYFRSSPYDNALNPYQANKRAFAALEAWREMAMQPARSPTQILQQAGECLAVWPTQTLQVSAEIQQALMHWSRQFESTDDMINAFWRLRVLISPWSGYKPESGIRVTTTVPPACRDIVVMLSAFTPERHPIQFAGETPDVYHAIVQE
ncbi:MAG: hypothetical protein AMXMBFR7_48200 [Planctomycetota bacterium]